MSFHVRMKVQDGTMAVKSSFVAFVLVILVSFPKSGKFLLQFTIFFESWDLCILPYESAVLNNVCEIEFCRFSA